MRNTPCDRVGASCGKIPESRSRASRRRGRCRGGRRFVDATFGGYPIGAARAAARAAGAAATAYAAATIIAADVAYTAGDAADAADAAAAAAADAAYFAAMRPAKTDAEAADAYLTTATGAATAAAAGAWAEIEADAQFAQYTARALWRISRSGRAVRQTGSQRPGSYLGRPFQTAKIGTFGSDWSEDRLRGGSRGEDYELVFASVPLEVWDEARPPRTHGSRRICRRLRSRPDRPSSLRRCRTSTRPSPMAGAPRRRVAVVAGAQNLPFYPHFSSEEDHRRALEAARVGGERLLKALRGGRYNARPEYGEALEYYLDDLPKTAGAGNILIANDQIRILHAMFLADAAMLPEGFASRLKSVIANQFALNAFYDLVQRHNEAVSAGNWAQPFPLDAARGFFGAVEDNTPRWFEPEVEQGLRQVEQAEPPPAAPPEPGPPSAIEPPPLPPGTPDAQELVEAADGDGSERALGDLPARPGHAGRHRTNGARRRMRSARTLSPILEFLRAQEEGKGKGEGGPALGGGDAPIPLTRRLWRHPASGPRRREEVGAAQPADSARQTLSVRNVRLSAPPPSAKRSRAGPTLPVDFAEAPSCSPNPSRSSSPTPTPMNPSRWSSRPGFASTTRAGCSRRKST